MSNDRIRLEPNMPAMRPTASAPTEPAMPPNDRTPATTAHMSRVHEVVARALEGHEWTSKGDLTGLNADQAADVVIAALDEVIRELWYDPSRWKLVPLSHATDREEALGLLADLVVKCTEYGTQEGGFVAMYLLPTGPVHRAIPWLEQRGVIVRPGFDGRRVAADGAEQMTVERAEARDEQED